MSDTKQVVYFTLKKKKINFQVEQNYDRYFLNLRRNLNPWGKKK